MLCGDCEGEEEADECLNNSPDNLDKQILHIARLKLKRCARKGGGGGSEYKGGGGREHKEGGGERE